MPIPDPVFLAGRNLAFSAASATVAPDLTAHARTLEQGIYQVAQRFYVAVGYGNANMCMVVGDDSVLLIDSLENAEAAGEALADLRRFSDKPIKGLIYTHSHPDHSSGSRGLLDPDAVARGEVGIIAHERLLAGMCGNPSLGIIAPLRLAYSFGFGLEHGAKGLVEVGLGPLLRTGTMGFLPPTQTFHGQLECEIAGIRFQLHEAPSESDDEIVLWFPDDRVLHVADVIQGECLANLYALRGAVRDIGQWIAAVDMLRSFPADAVISGHGRPLAGPAEVAELLQSYRDAMQFIHDQSLRLMSHGLTPDELVEQLPALPPHLRDHPWLGEFYGSVPQIVRQVYATYMGWFDGDPTTLDPLPRLERAARYVAAMGGRDAVMAGAQEAQAAGDFRWVAELLTHVLRTNPDDAAARKLKAEALRQLGFQTANPIWRNNYLMAASELQGSLDSAQLRQTLRALVNPDVAATMPITPLLRAFATRLNPERADGVMLQVSLRTHEPDGTYGVAVRSDIAEVLPTAPASVALELHCPAAILRELLAGRSSWQADELRAAATITRGTPPDAELFWSLFDPPVGELPALALR